MFALVDANNFYVSCEKIFDPSLAGKPVIVLSNNDGCIISRSNEAKALGLKMAEPAFNKKKFLKENNVQVFSSNYALYGDISQRMVQILKEFTPNIEIYSIDECFLDLSGMKSVDLEQYGRTIKRKVRQCLGINVGIGISKTKALAKIANRIAKKEIIYQGVCILKTSRAIDCALRNTPISDVWGIGRQYHKLLERNGIMNARDYACTNTNWIKKNLTVVGARLQMELNGTSCIPLETLRPSKKAIATTRGFGKIVTDVKYLQEAVATYATRCAEKLRRQGSVANIMTVFIHTDPFNKSEKYEYMATTFSLEVASNNQIELVKYALIGLKKVYQPGLRYKKAGVIVDGLENADNIQTGLFVTNDIASGSKLMHATDAINKKYGRDMIKVAIQGSGKEWKLKQEMLSPRYTTRWTDIIKVFAISCLQEKAKLQNTKNK